MGAPWLHLALFFRLNGPAEGVPTALPHGHCPDYAECAMSIRILIIDEHPSAREMLARRLGSRPDMDVVDATGDAEAGLRRIKELHPDVVLLDIKMHRADGVEVCRRACAVANGARVAILTSYSEPAERRMARQAGAQGYLLKEVDTPKLARWIKRLVGIPEDEADSFRV